MDEHRRLSEWIKMYQAGEFNKPDVNTQCAAGWYDWFCKDSHLPIGLKSMAPKVIRISKSAKVNPDKVYVFFKGNCPAGWGPLYDDFRICDLDTGDVIWTVIPKQGHYEEREDHGYFQRRWGHSSMRKVTVYHAEVWGEENDFDAALVEGTWNDVLKFFEV
jgi:hypothetical protein